MRMQMSESVAVEMYLPASAIGYSREVAGGSGHAKLKKGKRIQISQDETDERHKKKTQLKMSIWKNQRDSRTSSR